MKIRSPHKSVKKGSNLVQKLYFIISLFLAFGLALSFYRNLQKIRRVEKRITDKEERLRKIEEKNQEIKRRLEEVSSQEYVEKKLRDDLGLAKEGETIFVLPEADILRSLAPKLPEEEDELPPPNWKKWLNLLK